MDYTNHVLMILQKAREHCDLFMKHKDQVQESRKLDWFDRFQWLGLFSHSFLIESEERMCQYAIIEWSDEKVSFVFIKNGKLCPHEVFIEDILVFFKNPQNVKSLYDNEN